MLENDVGFVIHMWDGIALLIVGVSMGLIVPIAHNLLWQIFFRKHRRDTITKASK